jgi:hypothetical protein
MFAGLLLLLGAARLSTTWNLPLPFCALKKFTGIPCPFCGSTRCLQACSGFDFADAVRWNPLTFLTGVGVVLWFVAWITDRIFDSCRLPNLQCRLAVPALKFVVIGAVLLNWIYLCLTLP